MNSIRRFLLAATLAVMATAFTPQATAQDFGQDRAFLGTWYFFINFDGAPACQCIQIDTFRADGTLEGPAGDRLSGDQRGVWARSSDGKYTFTILQNNINADGSPGGIYVIKVTMSVTRADAGSGKFTAQLLSNGGTPVFSATGTLTATRIHP